jgi:hypothetical protein
MNIPLEIMLRGSEQVFTESIPHSAEPGVWGVSDLSLILKRILVAIDRAQNPGKTEMPEVELRGMSWIVHPTPQGVVIALEIHSASAVAGPINLPQQRLDDLIASAVRAARPADVVH